VRLLSPGQTGSCQLAVELVPTNALVSTNSIPLGRIVGLPDKFGKRVYHSAPLSPVSRSEGTKLAHC